MIPKSVQAREGFSLFGLHFSAFRSCASAHSADPRARWLNSVYPDCTGHGPGFSHAPLARQKGQLARPSTARQPLHSPQEGPANAALLPPALSPQEHHPGWAILPESIQNPNQTPNSCSSGAAHHGAASPRHPAEDFRLNEGFGGFS